MKSPIELMLENNAIKSEFLVSGLDIYDIWESTDDPLIDNKLLKELMAYKDAYTANPDIDYLMENGFFAPPIKEPMMPHLDWAIFEDWITGKSSIIKLSEKVKIVDVEEIDEVTLLNKLDELKNQIVEAGCDLELYNNLPPKMEYILLSEWILEEDPEIYPGGGWVMNGCGAYCPGCVQRPWCEIGADLCWTEDDEIQSIHHRPELKEYVSAWPGAYPAMRKKQDEKDAIDEQRAKEFEARWNNGLGGRKFD